MAADRFTETLGEALADLEAKGFDSAERVAYWQERLRAAALATLRPLSVIETELRDSLGVVYKRLVDNGQALRAVPGVGRFTLERIKPKLRAELDRRIVASANLIKLNRTAAIDTTLRRFAGWSTSIPLGGSDVVKRGETKEHIKKPLQSLRFEERRVAIDQGHKLNATIKDIVALSNNAIAAVWHSQWRRAGYNYRVEHKDRDGKVYAIRGCWALENGLMKVGAAGYTDAITQPAEEPYCSCSYRYIYSLRELPEAMLTAKGREALRQFAA